jgi:N-acetylmuramoyl-L-alanine amidase
MKYLASFLCILFFSSSIVYAATDTNVKRILIVPGHDDEYSGAAYGGIREVDLNRVVADYLVEELSEEPNVEVINAHDDEGYANFLEKYFKKESKKIDQFRAKAAKQFKKDVKKGKIDVEEAVPHGIATPVSAKRLYGINKWVNENDVDLVIHIHFNDYGSRPSWGGEYTGFSVYVPNSELKNGNKSIPIGKRIYKSLKTILSPSNNPTEAKYRNAIEDHELIALGANNSLSVPSVLIEYSYIYESHVNSEYFDGVAEEMAHQTRLGLKDFLKSKSKKSKK